MNFNCSAITGAIYANDVEAFKTLINKRKRVDIADNLGYTSLHAAAETSETVDPYILDTLLNHPEVEINYKTVEGFTSLYLACSCSKANMDFVKKLLQHGADPNMCNMEDISPLHIACKRGNLPLVQLLLEHNANINQKDFNGYTALHYSIEKNFENIAVYLLSAGADANIENDGKLNALMFALMIKREFAHIFVDHTKIININTLRAACIADNIEMFQLLLNKLAPDSYSDQQLLLLGLKHGYQFFYHCWLRINPENIQNYAELFLRVLMQCNRRTDFRPLQLILNDERLKGRHRICEGTGILEYILCKPPEDLIRGRIFVECFTRYEYVYRHFFQFLIDQNIELSSRDLLRFVSYFRECSYRNDILQKLLNETKSKPDITEDIVVDAFCLDLEMGALLMKHCLHIYPDNLFTSLCRQGHTPKSHRNRAETLEYVCKYFTPSKSDINKLLISHPSVTNLQHNVKSLRELSRDAVRAQFQETCDTSSEFLERVDLLNIPNVLKDILRLRL